MCNNSKEENKKEYIRKINEIYNKSVEKAHKTEEFTQNSMQIHIIKDILIKELDAPERLINWLIDSVSANKEIETKEINNQICKYLMSKN